jgi:hypothetical protein
MLIAMLDRLGQRQRHWNHPRRATALPSQLPLAIGSHEDALIAMPAIAEPVQLALMGPLDGGGHRSLNQVLAQWTGGTGDHEATVPILDEVSPAFSLVRLLLGAVFFCTHDQNSSISTWFKCRSLASTCVRASACVAARFSHTLIVSSMCPLISSAARKLPRRITINSAWATSAAGVFNPSIGVPCVAPK